MYLDLFKSLPPPFPLEYRSHSVIANITYVRIGSFSYFEFGLLNSYISQQVIGRSLQNLFIYNINIYVCVYICVQYVCIICGCAPVYILQIYTH